MSRYFTRTRAATALWVGDDDIWSDASTPTPTVPDHDPIDTGLMDVNGDAIMRAPNPMGFGKDDEW